MKHGDKKVVKLVINEISTQINKNGLVSFVVVPEAPFYEKGVWQATAADVDRLTRSVGFYDRFTAATIITANAKKAGDDCHLVLALEYCEAGQPIGQNEDGSPIMSKDGHTTFQKSFWNVRESSMQIGDDVVDKVSELAMKIGVELAKDSIEEQKLAARTAKKEAQDRKAGIVTKKTETPVDTGLDDVTNP